MEEKIIRCPICGKIVALEKGGNKQKIENVNGICWDEFGYSLGGWGSGKILCRNSAEKYATNAFI